MSRIFNVDITAKIHRVMRHVLDELIFMGYLRRGFSAENEMKHNAFKQIYNNTNKNISTIALQLLLSTSHTLQLPEVQYEQHEDTPKKNCSSVQKPSRTSATISEDI